jgi:hypothetical protein
MEIIWVRVIFMEIIWVKSSQVKSSCAGARFARCSSPSNACCLCLIRYGIRRCSPHGTAGT